MIVFFSSTGSIANHMFCLFCLLKFFVHSSNARYRVQRCTCWNFLGLRNFTKSTSLSLLEVRLLNVRAAHLGF